MPPSPARRQALALAAVAVVAGGAYWMTRDSVRARWLVARATHPAAGEAEEESLRALKAMGPAGREALLDLLRAPGGKRSTKSWIAAALLRSPFFARDEVRACLASADPATRRGAAFALLGGENFVVAGEELLAVAQAERRGSPPNLAAAAGVDAADLDAAVPVLLEWLADREDFDGRHAARLLCLARRDDARVPAALVKVVEEVPSLLGPSAPPDADLRKFAVVASLQSLLPFVHKDPTVVPRVAAVMRAVAESPDAETAWDVQSAALRLFEVAGGAGLDGDLLERLSRSPEAMLRQKLAFSLDGMRGPAADRALRALLGDAHYAVRRAALKALAARSDPWIVDNLRYLAEDAYPPFRADALLFAGEHHRREPERVEPLLPFFAQCLEDPWPGAVPPAYVPLAVTERANTIEAAALALFRITGAHHGFVPDAMRFDEKGRRKRCLELAKDPAALAEVAKAWRATVPPEAPGARLPHLVRHLAEDADPENILRAMRELSRIAGRSDHFPAGVLAAGADDTAARNAIREWMKSPERAKAVEAWKGK